MMTPAQRAIEAGWSKYNTEWPRSSLEDLTPQELLERGLTKEEERVSLLTADSTFSPNQIGCQVGHFTI
jgi:hypothetical protein